MCHPELSIKRQLLADLFEGKTDALWAYQRQQAITVFPFRWVIDARAVDGKIMAVNKNGNQHLMSEQDFQKLPIRAPIWRIVDYSGGIKPPEIDGDY